MRTIKFRGKRVDNGEWVYGSLLVDSDVKTCWIDGYDYYTSDNGYEREGFSHQVDPETVGQFAGLTDRNGKEIYEGDRFRSMLSAGKSVGTIKYIDDRFKVVWDEPNYGCLNNILRVHATEGEVIGNMYEQMD